MLVFNPNKLRRTMTKSEWKEADRWRRIVSRLVAIEMEKNKDEVARQLSNLMLFGTTHPELFDGTETQESRRLHT